MLALRRVGPLAAAVVGGLVLAAARAVGAAQTALRRQDRPRPLTPDEHRHLALVFGAVGWLAEIRVVPARSGVLAASRRAVTLGTTIHLKGSTSTAVLVHEAVHVWQYRRSGARYVVDAVAAQRSATGYDWRAAVAAGVTRWRDLNAEAQAQCVQDVWSAGTGTVGGVVRRGDGAFLRAHDEGGPRDLVVGTVSYRALADDALAALRAGDPDVPRSAQPDRPDGA